jgi:hypothetical protein
MASVEQIRKQNDARLALAEYVEVSADRNRRIKEAVKCGVPVNEVARMIGMSRSRVGNIARGL